MMMEAGSAMLKTALAVIDQNVTQFVLPAWAVIVGFLATVVVSFTVLWNWLDGLIDRAVEQAVDHAMDQRFSLYEQRQLEILADVAYIRGVLDQMNRR